MGKPVAFFDKYSRGSKDYHTLSKEIIFLDKKDDKVDQAKVKIVEKTVKPFSRKMQEVVAEESKEFFTTCFEIEAPGAKSVYVTGSFNDWSLDDGCRLEERDGQWRVGIPLKAGFYKYQFIIDGVWKEDPKNARRERNSFGDINSIVEVKSSLAFEKN